MTTFTQPFRNPFLNDNGTAATAMSDRLQIVKQHFTLQDCLDALTMDDFQPFLQLDVRKAIEWKKRFLEEKEAA